MTGSLICKIELLQQFKRFPTKRSFAFKIIKVILKLDVF